ncbi:MAG: hypothetical protein WC796_00310 [Candidatus Pacearchaeota archaeon]|jgi:hypothetical protein
MVKGERRLKQIESYVEEQLRLKLPSGENRYSIVTKPVTYPNSARDPDYYSFCLISNEGDPSQMIEVMQLSPRILRLKAEEVKTTIAFSRLKLSLPQAIEDLRWRSKAIYN